MTEIKRQRYQTMTAAHLNGRQPLSKGVLFNPMPIGTRGMITDPGVAGRTTEAKINHPEIRDPYMIKEATLAGENPMTGLKREMLNCRSISPS